jgi:DNA polymerase-1
MMNPNFLVIDGDILCYRAACAVQEQTEWDEYVVTMTYDKEEGKRCLTNMVNRILRNLKNSGFTQDRILFCLSGPSDKNYRKEIWEDYKGNRVGSVKPIGLPYLRSHGVILSCLPVDSKVKQVEDLEADDLVGMYMSRGFLALSDDKDLKTCPGWLGKLTDELGNHFIEELSPKDANWWLTLQTLSGDSTDGIPGCPKVGIKTAEKLVNKFLEDPQDQTLWEFIVSTYENAGLTEEDATRTFHMVYILRDKNKDVSPQDLLTIANIT